MYINIKNHRYCIFIKPYTYFKLHKTSLEIKENINYRINDLKTISPILLIQIFISKYVLTYNNVYKSK